MTSTVRTLLPWPCDSNLAAGIVLQSSKKKTKQKKNKKEKHALKTANEKKNLIDSRTCYFRNLTYDFIIIISFVFLSNEILFVYHNGRRFHSYSVYNFTFCPSFHYNKESSYNFSLGFKTYTVTPISTFLQNHIYTESHIHRSKYKCVVILEL